MARMLDPFQFVVGRGCRLDEPAPAADDRVSALRKTGFFASNLVIVDCVSMMTSAVA